MIWERGTIGGSKSTRGVGVRTVSSGEEAAKTLAELGRDLAKISSIRECNCLLSSDIGNEAWDPSLSRFMV